MPYLIGIAGGTACGKTSILTEIQASLPAGSVCIVSQDNYYRPITEQKTDVNGVVNFDEPESIDLAHFLQDVRTLMAGKSIEKTEYTFNNDQATPKIIRTNPCEIIVVEGLFVFDYQPIAELLDLKIFVDADEEIRLQRRIKRDGVERGYPEHDVRYRWQHHIQPSFERYLLPHKTHCDLVIMNNSSYQKGVSIIVNHLKCVLL